MHRSPKRDEAASAKPVARVALFFAITLAFTWSLQLPAVLALRGVLPGRVERFMPLLGLGGFGPMVAAMVLARGEPGGLRGLFSQLRRWNANPAWYVAALLLPAVLISGGLALLGLLGRYDGPMFFPPNDAQRVVALLLFPFIEEIGWRGYALPRLQCVWSPLTASLVIGAIWAIWHVCMLLVQGVPVSLFLPMIPYFLGGSVVFTWFFNRAGASLPAALLLHVGAHLDNAHRVLPGETRPFYVATVGFVLAAIGLVALDRKAWASRRVAEGAA